MATKGRVHYSVLRRLFFGELRIIVVIKDAEGKTLETWQKGEGADVADIFLMRIFGPFDIPSEK